VLVETLNPVPHPPYLSTLLTGNGNSDISNKLDTETCKIRTGLT